MEVQVPVMKAVSYYERSDDITKYSIGDRMSDQLASLQLTSSNSTSKTDHGNDVPKYRICRVGESDCDRALDFLKRTFFHDEPLNMAVDLLPHENSTSPELEEFSLSTLRQGHSIMAVNGNDDIIGVCANAVTDLTVDHTEENLKNADACPDPKFRKIQRLLANVDKDLNIRDRYPDAAEIADVRIIAVDGAYRGQGIAKVLLDCTMELVRKMGIPILLMECTSAFSAKAAIRMGFQIIYRLRFEDYKDGGTEPIFKPESPHYEVAVGVIEL